MIEIRWHSRGGQGAKTASLLLADVAFNTGKFIQGFPEYGPERMGAPITAYNRISDTPIRIHSNIYEPDFVVVVDDSLIGTVNVKKKKKKDGSVIINTNMDEETVREKLNGYEGNLYIIDATRISVECLKAIYPNTAMLAAVIKVTSLMSKEELLKNMEEAFNHKFSKKPEVIQPNMEALRRGFDEIKGGKNG